jgi:hypothetical protein
MLHRVALFVFLRSMRPLLITVNVVATSTTVFTQMMEVPSSSEMSVLTRATRRINPEDALIHGYVSVLK